MLHFLSVQLMVLLTTSVYMEVPPSGSKVRIIIESRMGKQTHEGVIISPAGNGLVTIKLQNGYNLSHPLEGIDSIELIENPKESFESENTKTENDMNQDLPLVILLHTGGTIASKVDYETGAVIARFEPDEILDSVTNAGSSRIYSAEKMKETIIKAKRFEMNNLLK